MTMQSAVVRIPLDGTSPYAMAAVITLRIHPTLLPSDRQLQQTIREMMRQKPRFAASFTRDLAVRARQGHHLLSTPIKASVKDKCEPDSEKSATLLSGCCFTTLLS